jgi:hypothetical protein
MGGHLAWMHEAASGFIHPLTGLDLTAESFRASWIVAYQRSPAVLRSYPVRG